MSFEKVVLQKVAKVLKQDRQAYFAYGTLFVECTEEQARKVFHKLSEDYGLGKVQVAKTPEEFSFDFVA
jgi:uncharacterized lipoprotein YehR (DUF1307 family)